MPTTLKSFHWEDSVEFLSLEFICVLNAKPKYSTFLCLLNVSYALQAQHVKNCLSLYLNVLFLFLFWFSQASIAQMRTLGVLLEPLPHISFKYQNPVDLILSTENSITLKYAHSSLYSLLPPYSKILPPLTRNAPTLS